MTLEERIAGLERRCRRLTLVLMLTVGGLGVACLAGAAPKDADTIRTKKLEVIDGDGRVRVMVGPADAGYGVVVNDAQGAFRATLTDAPGGACVWLRKDGGQVKLLALEAGAPGMPAAGASVVLSDNKNRSRLAAEVKESGSPAVRLLDSGGGTVFVAPTK